LTRHADHRSRQGLRHHRQGAGVRRRSRRHRRRPGSDLSHGEVETLEAHNEQAEDEEDNTEDELAAMISTLNEDEQIELVALAWLGRGSYSVEEWADAVSEATRAHNDRTAQYLMGMPLLADYLEEGLAAFELSCD
jgi:DNA-directed RNA polymerase specialized sigma24 family protein